MSRVWLKVDGQLKIQRFAAIRGVVFTREVPDTIRFAGERQSKCKSKRPSFTWFPIQSQQNRPSQCGKLDPPADKDLAEFSWAITNWHCIENPGFEDDTSSKKLDQRKILFISLEGTEVTLESE